ncbi:hypothetical protein JHK85_030913 [Glycine max]|nr:hypothetical protein JHK85_030913 [Glycine max]
MAASKLTSCVAVTSAAVVSMSAFSDRAYADSYFRLPFFSSKPSNEPSPPNQTSDSKSEPPPPDEPNKSGGFDPESLERGAKALREINSSPYSKQLFDLMRKQEETRLAELDAEKVHYELIQSQGDIERQRKMAEEQRNLIQDQAQRQAQIALAFKLASRNNFSARAKSHDESYGYHEAQRQHNVELVKMQEQSSFRKEQARQATEEQIQSQQRQTERERAEIERETIRVKAMAEAEGRAHEAKLTEDHNRRMLIERMQGERDKWLAAINTTFSHIEGGLRALLTDRDKLLMTVGGATALAAGIYTTREGSKVTWGYINRILGQPSLIRESSMAKFPGSEIISQAKNKVLCNSTLAGAEKPIGSKNGLGNGLHYAMMTGGDVAPLGAQAVTKIHDIFDWAKKSRKGLLLFIDEADAFLCERNSSHMSEAQRSALNALLFRTGDQSRDIVLVLATNRPGDLDSAVTDRIDEVIEFPLPGEEERLKLLKLYLNKYLCDDNNGSKGGFFLKKQPQKITIKDLSEDVFREAAKKTEGFSGREIAKLMASVQAAVYGRPDCILDAQLFREIVDYKVVEHHQRLKLAAEGGQPCQI